ncbi:MAG: 5'-methylthioadenosine/S-adenosylhomocysteine nucleosidase [Clostridia bacterium]|nr:5'-methylthioadenosine/S-adenosylhomocysteine nucleosidase [Clostridia bacterium]
MTVFVIAMDSEAEPILYIMSEKVERRVHERRIILGKIDGRDVGVVICGVGKVNAAAGTQYAIDCLNADKIVNVGVAGGLNGGTEVGNIYSISQAVQYDFDLVHINKTHIGTLNEYTEPYLKLAVCPLYPEKLLATGDRFNDSKRDYHLLTDVLKADIRDMECGAIAHVCKHSGVPCYSFKAISDVAGSGSTTRQFVLNLALCAKNLGDSIAAIFKAVDNG